MRQIALDTETTGLRTEDNHRIIEIGCVEIIHRRITRTHFHYYINPERDVDEGAKAIHGIGNDFLADKPKFNEIAQAFIQFITGAELIIHNAPFDVGFIEHELRLLVSPVKSIRELCQVTDTLVMARKQHMGQKNTLDALCKRYGIDNSKREWHGALLDAHLLAQVYLAMTGGQESLFQEVAFSETNTDKQASSNLPLITVPRELSVLKATAREEDEHDDYLAWLAGKGNCVWDQKV